ncbi:immune inhibitor A domain-containing protein [Sphaerisporangium sp. TRM90804]|uniref:immune inhibitor A domain-containing protein n=1 Tax=Sphaerisporangium sp. TRM90804 TaxID=3031113 RepID=UPI00244CB69E|nr:immune inhibitor A domain-containing protein [Sphaerisporangium sp. TRM90804]MDH2424066.1 immune inhibitor A [Sphaerisporangium sp. TRM90804]
MSRRVRRLVAVLPVLGLAAAGLAVTGAAAPGDTTVARYTPKASDYYINYAPPRAQSDTSSKAEEKVDTGAAKRGPKAPTAEEFDHKFGLGYPVAARELTKRERMAARTGKNPFDFIYKKSKTTQQAKLLTLLLEFNENANDDFSGFNRPVSTEDTSVCVTEPPGTLLNGPLHNNIPDPATAAGGGKDNNSMWVPDFNTAHFNKMLYSKEGITTRVRKDLKDPRDGKPGIDISGSTMKNMYEEMSKGAYTVDGAAIGWLKMPHSEAWYGAGRCGAAPQDMSGHPDNPRGPGQLAIDAVNVLAAQDPSFPWADYDLEDTGDADGDGNVLEPDGVVDHLVLVHAGEDKSGGGGAEGPYAIWAHSSAVAGGYTVPGNTVKISNYIVQPEDSGVGVFAHEYGHDLGLPDLYDATGAGDSDVEFWDLMSTGSHSGPIFQSLPTHMGIWDKWVLGWANPKVLNPGDAAKLVTIGQTSRTPKLTEDGLRINLPDKDVTLTTPHSGANVWWSSNDQDWADVKLTRDIAVPAGADTKFRFWNDYTIEADWDYGFVEVSTDGGATWSEQKVYGEDGTLVSTDDDYADPNNRMQDYGNKKYGLTGDSGGWQHYYVDLAPFAGASVKLRLRYATDAAANERGWFADDFSVTSGATTVWSDDVESGDAGWTAARGTWTDTSGAGWVRHSGSLKSAQYYLAEWRNFDGYDKGLKYTYDTTWLRDGAWKVEKLSYNAPGLLLWLRDTSLGYNNPATNIWSLPSAGSKGQLLLVDSHFDPLRRTGEAAAVDPSVTKNIPSRPQSSNAAFGFGKTYAFKECLEGAPFTQYCTQFSPQNPVKDFTDAKTWYPGLESREDGLYYRLRDASVVVPSKGNQQYSVRVVNPDGSPATDLYGETVNGFTLGTGNPGDEGKQLGTKIKLVTPLPGNLGVIVHVTPPKK